MKLNFLLFELKVLSKKCVKCKLKNPSKLMQLCLNLHKHSNQNPRLFALQLAVQTQQGMWLTPNKFKLCFYVQLEGFSVCCTWHWSTRSLIIYMAVEKCVIFPRFYLQLCTFQVFNAQLLSSAYQAYNRLLFRHAQIELQNWTNESLFLVSLNFLRKIFVC